MSTRTLRLGALALAVALAAAPAAAEAATRPSGTAGNIFLWEMIRASGLAAFLLVSASVFLGIGVRAKALDNFMKRALSFEAHRTLALAALAFITLHLLLLLVNRHVSFTPVAALLPFASSWRPVPVALGTLAFYLAVVLVASSYGRKVINQKTWRLIHYASFAAWAMALVHGILAGSDSSETWVQFLYLISGGAVGLMVILRLLSPAMARPVAAPGDDR